MRSPEATVAAEVAEVAEVAGDFRNFRIAIGRTDDKDMTE